MCEQLSMYHAGVDAEIRATEAVCRTCLTMCRQVVPLKSQLPISSSVTERKTYLECLRICTQLEVPLGSISNIKTVDYSNVNESDVVEQERNEAFKYPEQICLRCSKALQVAFHFITLAYDTEYTLRSQAKKAEQTTAQCRRLATAGFDMENKKKLTGSKGLVKQPALGKHPLIKMPKTETTTNLTQTTTGTNEFNTQFNKYLQENEESHTARVLLTCQMNTCKAATEVDSSKVKPQMHALTDITTVPDTCIATDNTDVNMLDNAKDFEDGRKYFDSLDGGNDIIIGVDADVLTEIENQHLCKPTSDYKEHYQVTEMPHSIIEEIKENLNNTPSDLSLVRNKATTLHDVQELEKALKANEVELHHDELVCVQCNKRFNDMHVFIRHRNRHKGITPFRCNLCNFFTCYSESLRKHYNKNHDIEATNDMLNLRLEPNTTPAEQPYYETTFRCQKCNFQAHEESVIETHLTRAHVVHENLTDYFTTVFNCPDCYRTFKDQKSMRLHFTLTHGDSMGVKKNSYDTFICEHCNKHFNFKASLTSHQRVCRLREGVCCNFCAKKFVTVRKFERHLRTEHNVETIHECEVCGKTFNNPNSLSMHRKRHSERHFQCEKCPRNYANSWELKVHIQRTHSTETKALCRVCGAKFTHIGFLRDHENKEHFKKYFQCRYCDYQCTTRCNLRIHHYTHTGKPYKCGICGKEYALRAILRRHCKNAHDFHISDEELGAMFRKKFGYPSRYDAFSRVNNSLEITEVTEADIELELKEFGLKFDDIVNDLFANNCDNDVLMSHSQ